MDVTGKVGARPGAGRGRRRSAAVAMTLAVGLVAGDPRRHFLIARRRGRQIEPIGTVGLG